MTLQFNAYVLYYWWGGAALMAAVGALARRPRCLAPAAIAGIDRFCYTGRIDAGIGRLDSARHRGYVYSRRALMLSRGRPCTARRAGR